jgi:hypothetical protein
MPSTQEIHFNVDPEIARAFLAAPAIERKKMEMLLRLRLREIVTPRTETLESLLVQSRAYAKSQGLTEELLDQLLADS